MRKENIRSLPVIETFGPKDRRPKHRVARQTAKTDRLPYPAQAGTKQNPLTDPGMITDVEVFT